MNTKHGFLNLCGRAVYATLYMPDAQPEKAVVMCEPFADEKRCAFRMIVRLAEKLVSAGIAVMRFDVSGTGDSASSHADAEWDNWCAETVAAVDFIKQHSGAKSCHLMGFRSGALLAAYAAVQTHCENLSLVEPILTGASLLKDLELRQGIQSMMNAKAKTNDGTAETVEDNLPEGFKDFAGFVVNPTLA
ncbi:MAG: alpha/beta hydrolase, partial [Victivallales bacterium]|nr:alpha/beta hydrolase [Victivallales bacterium]